MVFPASEATYHSTSCTKPLLVTQFKGNESVLLTSLLKNLTIIMTKMAEK